MTKTFNISTNLNNGAGLQRDYELVRRLLESYGHKVNGLQFNVYNVPIPPADVTIFMEVINFRHLSRGKQYGGGENWFVPNSEWYYPCWNEFLPQFDKILCKTKDSYRIWSKKVGAAKCIFTGFESNDFYQPDTPREPTFLHMAGKSETKNTQAVCEAWKQFHLPYKLTVVAFKPEIVRFTHGVPNCVWIERLTDEGVANAMNKNLFHVMPSKYEGFGHYIHEAIGCGGIVLTTDAPPMNEFNGIHKPFLIPVQRRDVRLEAFFNIVSPQGVADAVCRAATIHEADILALREFNRKAFLSDREEFRTILQRVANA